MQKKRAEEIKKDEFKGSSKKDNLATGMSRNLGRQIKKTFK
jgi:hypothetical protein